MSTLYYWIALALLGLFLYMLPGFFIRPMYEAFETQPSSPQQQEVMAAVAGGTTSAGPSATTTPALQEVSANAKLDVQPSTAVTNSAPAVVNSTPKASQAQVASVADLLRSLEAIQTPNIQASPELPSPTARTEAPVTNGVKAQPEHSSTNRSQPAMPVNHSQDSGESLKQGAAFKAMIVPTPVPVIKERIVLAQECPKCEDMSKYIRKDSIPCWGCKLS